MARDDSYTVMPGGPAQWRSQLNRAKQQGREEAEMERYSDEFDKIMRDEREAQQDLQDSGVFYDAETLGEKAAKEYHADADSADIDLNNQIDAFERYKQNLSQHSGMFAPEKVFNVKKLSETRFPDYEYAGFMDMNEDLSDTDRLDMVSDNNVRSSEPDDVKVFAHMSTQSNAQYDNLKECGLALYNDKQKLELEKANYDLNANFSCKIWSEVPEKRRELDFIEQGLDGFRNSHNVSDDELQCLIDMPNSHKGEYETALSLATSEMRTIACVDGSDKTALTADMYALYRYFSLQDKMRQFPNWQEDLRQADKFSESVYGKDNVDTGKAMARDYLMYLENVSPNGEMEAWDKTLRYITSYPDDGELSQFPRPIDPYKAERERFYEYRDKYDKLSYGKGNQFELFKLAANVEIARLKSRNSYLDAQKADNEANIRKTSFFKKARLDHFENQYQRKHHGTQHDLKKLHPDEYDLPKLNAADKQQDDNNEFEF